MDKRTLEWILQDCDRAKRFCEQKHACDPCFPTLTPQSAAAEIRRPEYCPGTVHATPDEIHANFNCIRRDYSPRDIRTLSTSLARVEPLALLEVLTTRYEKQPSARNAQLLEHAINRLLRTARLDEAGQNLVQRALRVLREQTAPADRKDTPPRDDIQCWLFEHEDFGGTAAFFHPFPVTAYSPIRASELKYYSLHDRISSLRIDASADEVGASVVLFENDQYIGRYARFDASPGAPVQVSYVGGFINDRTSSVLIMRRFPNELMVTAGEYVSQETIRQLIQSRQDVHPRGNAVLTWDLWPTGPEKGPDSHPIAPQQAFVYIKIPVTAVVDNWPDYDAEIRYWLYPYVDATGTLQVELTAYGAWVEGGIITSQVLSSLMEKIPSTFMDVDMQLSALRATANLFGPFRFVYLLPGRFTSMGSTDEDVTLVLVRGTNPPDDGPIL